MLETLPLEIVHQIILSGSITDLLNISRINKLLLQICQDEYLWKCGFIQRYNNILVKPHFMSWKQFLIYLETPFIIPIYNKLTILDFISINSSQSIDVIIDNLINIIGNNINNGYIYFSYHQKSELVATINPTQVLITQSCEPLINLHTIYLSKNANVTVNFVSMANRHHITYVN